MPFAIGLGAALVLLLVVGWLFRRRKGVSPVSFERVSRHPKNVRPLQGLQQLESLWQLSSRDAVRAVTAADERRLRKTVGQLSAPTDPLFPLTADPLLRPCLGWVSSSLAWVHPDTGIVFGLRIGTYLCLLRLPGPIRQQALAGSDAWERNPLPNLRGLDFAALFGPEWVVPNPLSARFAELCRAAHDAAGA